MTAAKGGQARAPRVGLFSSGQKLRNVVTPQTTPTNHLSILVLYAIDWKYIPSGSHLIHELATTSQAHNRQ